jgi:lipoprotein NlpD
MTGRPLFMISSCLLHKPKFIGFLLIGLMILSCSGYHVRSDRRGVYHRVKSGETLSAIARAYHVKLQDLAEINNISAPDQIEAGSVIFIPDASQVLDDIMTAARAQEAPVEKPVADAPPAKTKTATSTTIPRKEHPKKETIVEAERQPEQGPVDAKVKERTVLSQGADGDKVSRKTSGKPQSEVTVGQPAKQNEDEGKKEGIQFDKGRFIWPLKGKVISRFGIQPNRMYFNGIRIAAGEGMAVQAAASGVVIFSAPLKDYGETIIIKHEDYYATVYAHLETRTVRGDSHVKKGDRIAFIGKVSDKEEPYLHFEIRHNNKARNPLFFLP